MMSSVERLTEQRRRELTLVRLCRKRANAEAQAAIGHFLKTLDQHEPPTPRQKAERRGLRVIEGGKTK